MFLTLLATLEGKGKERKGEESGVWEAEYRVGGNEVVMGEKGKCLYSKYELSELN